MKHDKSVDFCQFLCQAPPQKRKAPLLKTFWWRSWFHEQHKHLRKVPLQQKKVEKHCSICHAAVVIYCTYTKMSVAVTTYFFLCTVNASEVDTVSRAATLNWRNHNTEASSYRQCWLLYAS